MVTTRPETKTRLELVTNRIEFLKKSIEDSENELQVLIIERDILGQLDSIYSSSIYDKIDEGRIEAAPSLIGTTTAERILSALKYTTSLTAKDLALKIGCVRRSIYGTLSDLVASGELVRISRGLYSLPPRDKNTLSNEE